MVVVANEGFVDQEMGVGCKEQFCAQMFGRRVAACLLTQQGSTSSDPILESFS